MLNVLDNWTKILDESGSIDVVYMDFMKAFDKVPHRRLIGKVQSYGITGCVLGWMEDFLKDRTQCVMVNGECSRWTDVTSGIPQGSVLGPILFVIYINDLPDAIVSDSYLFADDTKISRNIRSEADTVLFQQDLDNLCR